MAANNREELLNLVPAYVIGALDNDDRAEIETWLEHDPDAQAILADYQAVADHLVALAPLRSAPDHLQADLRRRLAVSPRGTPVEHQPVIIRKPLKRYTPRILAAAALLTVIALGVLLVLLNLTEDPDSPSREAQLYAQLKAQPGSSRYEIVPGEVSAAVWGNMVVARDGDQAVLCVWDLPPIAKNQTFQMWLIDSDGARTSGGLFQADTSKNILFIQVPFDRPATAYQSIGVSLEPAGGSPYVDQPTGPRVLSVPLS